MIARGNIGRRIVAATVVAIGVAVTWGLLWGWLFSMGDALLGRPEIYESINFALDGTPVISVQSNATPSVDSLSRRTLDGQPWSNDYEFWLGGAYLPKRERAPRLIDFPVRWDQYGTRVAGMTDGKKPPTAWYVVSTDQQATHFYFIGYDPLSKLQVGYIGKNGFRLSAPPRDEQFPNADNERKSVRGQIASTQHIEPASIKNYHWLPNTERLAGWLMFTVDGERLWEIDLRGRTVRVVLDAPDSISTSIASTLLATVVGGVTDAEKPAVPAEPEDGSAAAGRKSLFRLVAMQDVFRAVVPSPALPRVTGTLVPDEEPPKTASVIAIRTNDRILLYDPPSGKSFEFKLPSDIPDKVLTVYWPKQDQLIVDCEAGRWSGGGIRALYWISPDGTVERQERVELQGYVPPPESRAVWQASVAAPVPIGWIPAVLGLMPAALIEDYKADTYSDALRQTFELAWPMALVVLIVSLAAAWYAMQLERQYFRPHSGTWTAFVFLFGPAGLAAYWLEHRQAKLEHCGECGANVPRDRDACAACATPFPVPSLVGTEIFA